MELREILRSVQYAEQSLRLPRRVTLEALQTYLATERNHEIFIEELENLPGDDICGMRIAMEDRELIIHAPTRSPLHRQQIILHEFAHMILKHDIDGISAELDSALIPDLDLAIVRHIFLRKSFSDQAELAAELLADRLSARIISPDQSVTTEHLAFREVFG